jgi:hypothetical protein
MKSIFGNASNNGIMRARNDNLEKSIVGALQPKGLTEISENVTKTKRFT